MYMSVNVYVCLLSIPYTNICVQIHASSPVQLSPHSYCRPKFNLTGPLVVKGVVHPILNSNNSSASGGGGGGGGGVGGMRSSSVVANDACMNSMSSSFQIITGPNGSGQNYDLY